MSTIAAVIQILFRLLTFVIIVDALLSFVMPPYSPVRTFLDRLVEPLLNPIRRIVPPIGGMDLSPLILILIIQGLQYFIIRIL